MALLAQEHCRFIQWADSNTHCEKTRRLKRTRQKSRKKFWDILYVSMVRLCVLHMCVCLGRLSAAPVCGKLDCPSLNGHLASSQHARLTLLSRPSLWSSSFASKTASFTVWIMWDDFCTVTLRVWHLFYCAHSERQLLSCDDSVRQLLCTVDTGSMNQLLCCIDRQRDLYCTQNEPGLLTVRKEWNAHMWYCSFGE